VLLDVPADTLVGVERGSACDFRTDTKGPAHVGCPGWWLHHGEEAVGWRCACTCHVEGAGWPAYSRWLDGRFL